MISTILPYIDRSTNEIFTSRISYRATYFGVGFQKFLIHLFRFVLERNGAVPEFLIVIITWIFWGDLVWNFLK